MSRVGTITITIALGALLFSLAQWPTDLSEAPQQPSVVFAKSSELHQVVGKLQYLLGDYPEAVSTSGVILDRHEYEEQQEILEDIEELLSRAPRIEEGSDNNNLLQQLESLQALVASRQPPDVVQKLASQLREGVIERYQLRMAPESLPSLAAGRQLFREACAACHGNDGRARTELAKQLRPQPTDLQALRLQHTLSAYQVYNVLTFGLSGTSMPSYELLSATERWALAFFVMSLRYEASRNASGPEGLLGDRPSPVIPLTVLAQATDIDLTLRLQAQGLGVEQVEEIVAALRCLQVLSYQ